MSVIKKNLVIPCLEKDVEQLEFSCIPNGSVKFGSLEKLLKVNIYLLYAPNILLSIYLR